MGYPLYKKMGFVETDLSSVYLQDHPVERHSPATPVYRLQPGDLDELAAFDTPLFGADRRNVLRVMMRDYPGETLATRDEAGRISGYVIVRDSRLSPWMAHDPASAERVLQVALDATLPGNPVALVPGVNKAGIQILERYGFRFKRSCRHMQRGLTVDRQRSQTYGMISYAIG
jgi:hypothetical protein